MGMSPDDERQPLRTDAERNRVRIIKAAHEVFADQGLDAPMAEVARRAGVGIATLARRFPVREDLIAATFADKMCAYADAIDAALADPDPWHGFCAYVQRVCAMQAEDRGFTHVLTRTFPSATALQADRERSYRGFVELIDRAKATGKLRAEFVPDDLILLLMANAGVITATGDDAPDAWRRVVAYMIQSFSTQEATPAVALPPPPPSKSIFRAMVGLGRGCGSANAK
jgi:AcrR family transcriptional regulator